MPPTDQCLKHTFIFRRKHFKGFRESITKTQFRINHASYPRLGVLRYLPFLPLRMLNASKRTTALLFRSFHNQGITSKFHTAQ